MNSISNVIVMIHSGCAILLKKIVLKFSWILLTIIRQYFAECVFECIYNCINNAIR